MKIMDAVAMGELLIDFACVGVDGQGYPTMAAHPGGAPANWLSVLQRFGAKTAMIGKVGTDAFGEMLINTLKNEGICTQSIVSADDVFTTLAFVTFDQSNDRHFSFARKPGADTRLCMEEMPLHLIDEARVFHFGSLSLTDEPVRSATKYAVSYARNKGALISFDPNLRKPLWNSLSVAKEQIVWGLEQSDVLKISDDEVSFLFGDMPYREAAERILTDFNVKLVYITLGKNGCITANKNGMIACECYDAGSVIDTTGAGDIFGGSAMWAVLQKGKQPEELHVTELEEITRFASVVAGISTTSQGGISSIPELPDVLGRL